MTDPTNTLPNTFATPYFEAKQGEETYAGLELPYEFFKALSLKPGDTLEWSRLVGGDFKVTINRK